MAKASFRFVAVRFVNWIWEVVPGGVIRAGKTAYTDDVNVGFWLGIDTADGLAKFNVGGATYYLKWTGSALEVSGDILGSTITGTVSVSGGALTWAGGKGGADDTGIWVELSNVYSDQRSYRFVNSGGAIASLLRGVYGAADNEMALRVNAVAGHSSTILLDCVAPSDQTATVGIAVESGEAQGSLEFTVGIYGVNAVLDSGEVHINAATAIDLSGAPVSVGTQKITDLADATADTDAMNRQSGDARYPLRSDGWSGTFATGDGRVATVADGVITGVV